MLAKDQTLPPLTITSAEATALAVALHALAGTPFARDARSALQKVLAVMPQRERHGADELAGRVRLAAPARQPAAVPQALREALSMRRVLRLSYSDAQGAATDRCVEPHGFLGGDHWYLIGWCRLRSAVRGFRLDRIQHVETLAETVPPRVLDIAELDTLGWEFVGLDELVKSDRGLSPEA